MICLRTFEVAGLKHSEKPQFPQDDKKMQVSFELHPEVYFHTDLNFLLFLLL